MKTVELTIINEEINGVFAISLVDKPAIKSNFVFFSDEMPMKFAETTDKKTVLGAILIPNLNILRVDENNEPFNIFLSTETVKKASELYLKKGFSPNVTKNHNEIVNGVFLVESWIKESEIDKSVHYGLDLPIGTWVGSFSVENEEIKKDLLDGKYKGFSIEGMFKEEQNEDEALYNEIVSILNK